MADDYYSLLGVPRDATSQDIKRSFRKLARECHPDVAGDSPTAVERFRDIRKAYETLLDPVTRARYDRRGQRPRHKGGSFFDAMYKRTGQAAEARQTGKGEHRQRRGAQSASRELGLDDLMGGLGGRPRAKTNEHTTRDGPASAPGRDVHVEVDVPKTVALRGGSITVTYFRMRRSDSWTPRSRDPGLVRIEEIAEIRILPGTEDRTLLTEHGLGDHGPWGGAAGDLQVRVRLVGTVEEAAPSAVGEALRVDIGVSEAMLGGRIVVDTPQGPVRMTVPPGTCSHARMRLSGKGPADARGRSTDLYVEFRIVVPKTLDAQSRRLVEEFLALNPS